MLYLKKKRIGQFCKLVNIPFQIGELYKNIASRKRHERQPREPMTKYHHYKMLDELRQISMRHDIINRGLQSI